MGRMFIILVEKRASITHIHNQGMGNDEIIRRTGRILTPEAFGDLGDWFKVSILSIEAWGFLPGVSMAYRSRSDLFQSSQ